MELIVHAGYPKSATSTIQAKLYASRDLLMQHGILYPSAGLFESERAHHVLGWALAGQALPTGSQPPRAEDILQALHHEAKAAAAKRIIISSESLSVVLRDHPDELTSVLQNGPFQSVRLELVVRRADEYLESFFFHTLHSWARNRRDAAIPKVTQARKQMLANPCGHLRIAENAMASKLPCRLRAYDRQGQVVNELLSDLLGDEAPTLFEQLNIQENKQQNLRSNSRFLALIYLLSQTDVAKRLQAQLTPHLKQLHLALSDGKPCGILLNEERRAIMQAANPVYQTLPGLQSLIEPESTYTLCNIASFESQWVFSAEQAQLVYDLLNVDLSCLAEIKNDI